MCSPNTDTLRKHVYAHTRTLTNILHTQAGIIKYIFLFLYIPDTLTSHKHTQHRPAHTYLANIQCLSCPSPQIHTYIYAPLPSEKGIIHFHILLPHTQFLSIKLHTYIDCIHTRCAHELSQSTHTHIHTHSHTYKSRCKDRTANTHTCLCCNTHANACQDTHKYVHKQKTALSLSPWLTLPHTVLRLPCMNFPTYFGLKLQCTIAYEWCVSLHVGGLHYRFMAQPCTPEWKQPVLYVLQLSSGKETIQKRKEIRKKKEFIKATVA